MNAGGGAAQPARPGLMPQLFEALDLLHEQVVRLTCDVEAVVLPLIGATAPVTEDRPKPLAPEPEPPVIERVLNRVRTVTSIAVLADAQLRRLLDELT